MRHCLSPLYHSITTHVEVGSREAGQGRVGQGRKKVVKRLPHSVESYNSTNTDGKPTVAMSRRRKQTDRLQFKHSMLNQKKKKTPTP